MKRKNTRFFIYKNIKKLFRIRLRDALWRVPGTSGNRLQFPVYPKYTAFIRNYKQQSPQVRPPS